ncbi:piggyBac transposable element-derived protein 3 [Nephila pilipes]|uniref:PiggyBac transposable element-derived protein 3 n=1 Tax=Nephila pilipes TaxID=299642 RepID=A0A8X6UNY1_NEPPI|nr:piggyBac transposable element-derived protein 3 [Nephila pilipes]
MNNLDELIEDGLEYSDDDVVFLPYCVSSNEDSDSDCENSVGSQNTIQNIKKYVDDNKLDRNISVREPFLNLTFKNNKTLSKNILWKNQNISLNEEVVKFHGDDTLPREIMDLDTPYQFFKYLWMDEIISNIYEENKLVFKITCIQKNTTYLSKEGIYSLGTINRNIIPNSKIPTEKVFNKIERGHSMEFFGNFNDIEISVTIWNDYKTVIKASTFAGEKPPGKVMRYDKKTKNRVEIIRTHIIEECNKHMGGVDLLDSIIARHKILLRIKKWYTRIFFSFVTSS